MQSSMLKAIVDDLQKESDKLEATKNKTLDLGTN